MFNIVNIFLGDSTLAWKIPWTEEPGRLQSMGSLRVGHDWATSLSFFTFMHWRREWQPTPVFLPGESQGWGTWWAAVYGVAQSRTRLKWLSSMCQTLGPQWKDKVSMQIVHSSCCPASAPNPHIEAKLCLLCWSFPYFFNFFNLICLMTQTPGCRWLAHKWFDHSQILIWKWN